MKHVEKRNKHTKKNVHQVGFIYKNILFNLISFVKFNKQHRI